MTKSVVSVSIHVGYNHCHTPRYRIKEAMNVSLGYSSPCDLHILPTLTWCSSGRCIPDSRCPSMDNTFSIGDRSGEQGSNSMCDR
ncbi:hypothetical protein TNCV_2180831 [Trichonephila clavipes]|uniref:Uncharacterized protein n=1 Tax=Trichonephila clavipes TaxID=2585209 RepID=A0A8X6VUM1_TRICX|nr:hypothetical protein TNCV_2180831 [Trichonephila clavipes]